MIIVNEKLCAQFRGRGLCELCGQWDEDRQCHHVHTKGTGRLDIRINLIALGYVCCHEPHHYCTPKREAILKAVAKREGTTPDAIKTEIYRLRRLDKSTTREQAGYPPRGKTAVHSDRRGGDGIPGREVISGPTGGPGSGEIDSGWVDLVL